MILLTVKITEGMKKSGSEFDRAWYRLVNSDTSQTLDYKKFKEISTPDAPGADDSSAGGDDGDEGVSKTSKGPSHTYIAGRIFFDHNGSGRWVYEVLNHVISTERVQKSEGDLGQMLATLYSRSEKEIVE